MASNELLVSLEDGLKVITLNRPGRKNCVTFEMYTELTRILNEDAANDNVIVTIITGSGEYFCSGNDFASTVLGTTTDENRVANTADILEAMVEAFLNYPKILVCIVNGPAIGVGCTIPFLCDIVYVSETATFEAPFVRLGLALEACASFWFPAILGKSKASEMTFFTHILTAKEAYHFGLAADIVPRVEIPNLIKKIKKFGKLPIKPVVRNKKLMTMHTKELLSKTNKIEVEEVRDCFVSEDFPNALAKFLSRKSKL